MLNNCVQDVQVYSVQIGVFVALNNTQHHVYTTFKNTKPEHHQLKPLYGVAIHACVSLVIYSFLLCCRTIGRCVTSILCYAVKDVGRKCPEDWLVP